MAQKWLNNIYLFSAAGPSGPAGLQGKSLLICNFISR